uniref:Uncharacterized protein n=1 Tax=Nelumbo nucifera TaxID=4432 RepID=A0A822YJI5_NELNU|nr:TPA_asm: hypothetical protein HUJ06_030996 [Nelumbo nucifera]
MHDTIGDLALRITTSSPSPLSGCSFFVRANARLVEFPIDEEEYWREANKISLMNNDISCLPERPELSSTLSTLLPLKNKHLEIISVSTYPGLIFRNDRHLFPS